ncbi:unnamed protein product [Periconia digitata]|uniref:DUF7053 domain-containing protein n=1 Tax=Periconia digitata TaxID=1303443 RepID=A0A9W4U130_9PLEO|nr:unnamed protein product [Periconia digitata]
MTTTTTTSFAAADEISPSNVNDDNMTLAKHHYHTAAPIPTSLSPADVIEALHDHNNALSLQALTTGHSPIDTLDPQIRKDTFWYPPDIHPIQGYSVTEVITYMPYFSWGRYNLTFPTNFQNTPNGLKTRADASGVILRAEFRVLRGDSAESVVDGEGAGLGDVEFVLVEDVEVQCSWYMMPFVRSKMEAAHADICRKVVEKVIMEKTMASVAKQAAIEKNKSRADTPTSVGSQPHSIQIHSQSSTPTRTRYSMEGGKPVRITSPNTPTTPAKMDSSFRVELPVLPDSPLEEAEEERLAQSSSSRIDTPDTTPEEKPEKDVVVLEAAPLPDKITYK